MEPGDRVGRYSVLYRLGAGGMGVVFAAHDPELDRKIALKLLRPRGRDPARLARGRQRMLDEAKALACLSHPNVVEVHHVGEHRGRVYVAMELIDGLTLTRWLLAEERSRDAILEVYMEAGHGLAAAHEADIVHRDFKPDNVMIGSSGRVTVMDFGLAQARGAGSSTATQATGDGMAAHSGATKVAVGTRAYMAPEQQRSGSADARADQFSFCVALFESLVGHHPFEGATADQRAEHMLAGNLVPASLGRRIPPPLREVIVRGLAVQPEQRWPSMAALLDALERQSDARRRGRVLGGVAGAGAFASVAALLVALPGAPEVCEGAEDKLADAWHPARAERIAAAFSGADVPFGEDTSRTVRRRLDAYADAWLQQYAEACRATHVRHEQSEDLLDRRMRCLSQKRRDFEALVDVFERADAAVVERAVSAVGELAAVDRCADVHVLTATLAPPEEASTAREVDSIRGTLAQAQARESAGRYVEGLDVAQDALRRAEATAYPPVVPEARLRVGSLLRRLGRYEEAEQHLSRAFWTAQEVEHDRAAAAAAVEMVFLVGYSMARPEDGRVWSRHAEATIERLADPDELVAKLENSLGVVAWSEADHAAARRHHERALAVREAAGDPDSTAIAVSLFNLGDVLVHQGMPLEARRYFERAMEIYDRAVGHNHPLVAFVLQGQGEAWLAEGAPDAAIDPLTRALAIRERQGVRPGLTALTRATLARALWDAAETTDDPEATRTRARTLAVLAEHGFSDAGDVRRSELDEVRAWLAAHPAPAL